MRQLIKLFIILFCLVACSDDDSKAEKDINNTSCSNSVIIDQELYQSIESSHYDILNAQIEEDFLVVTISSNGCNGEDWKVCLIEADNLEEYDLLKRNLRISLVNNQFCEALIAREFSFDLRPIKEEDEILIGLVGWEPLLQY